MCGIAGRVSPARRLDVRLVAAMSRAVAHRGPDGDGLLVRPHVALAHRRLAIVDVAGGQQPLSNEDGTVWISYNGEVYNHAALRADLEARGHRFRTRSDTEAIVHAYEEDGPACVHRLRGMFAFAIWDARRRRLVLARDRLGIKPLYYARAGGDLLFASDLRALLLAPEVDRGLDEEALACYLALRYVPAPATLVRGVRKLPPATLLVWENGAVRTERYWDLLASPAHDAAMQQDHRASQQTGGARFENAASQYGVGAAATEAETAAQLRELVDESVALRLMSEVPLGAFLSGGLDSTLVTASMLAARSRAGAADADAVAPDVAVEVPRPPRLEQPLRTFAVGYGDDPAASELGWAALAAHALGTTHRERRVTDAEACAQLPQIVGDLDEPLADPAAVPLWFLARRAREEVTVVLSGEGGDELFAGYAAYRTMERLGRLHALGVGGVAGAFARLAPSGRVRRALHLASLPLEQRYRGVSRAFAFDGQGAESLLGGEDARRADRAVQAVLEPIWEATRDLSPLRRMLYLDHRVWLPDDLLVKADKITMASAIELRVPLLDHVLVEYAWSLPDRFKLRGAEGKRILRRAARGRVPEAILARPKMGFATPTAEWLRGPLAPLLGAVLLDGASLSRERFRRAHVESLIEAHRRGRADHTPELWSLLVLELWRLEVEGIRCVDPSIAAEVSR